MPVTNYLSIYLSRKLVIYLPIYISIYFGHIQQEVRHGHDKEIYTLSMHNYTYIHTYIHYRGQRKAQKWIL